ncbi:MAG: hypothetical protein HYY18_07150, partial [Planctomycetes bacterium]|nr:hypothetical protein [Planctomycetota bacterium]
MRLTSMIGVILAFALLGHARAEQSPAAGGDPSVETATDPPAAEPGAEPAPADEKPATDEPPAKEEPPKEEPPAKEEPLKEPPAAEEKAPGGPLDELLGFPVRGRLAFKYRGRWADLEDEDGDDVGDDDDNDLYAYLSLDLGDAKKHTVTASFFLRGSLDLDEEDDDQAFFVFNDLTD